MSAESELPAAIARQVEALAAIMDDVLAEEVDGRVGDVLGVRVADDGLHVRIEALEHVDDPQQRSVSVCEVVVDDGGTIVDVVREG